MKLSFSIVESLPQDIFTAVKKIFDNSSYRFFHQDPEWLIRDPEKKPVLIAWDDSGKIISYAGLDEKPFRTIHISFGPVIGNPQDLPDVLLQAVKWLKAKGYWRLAMQLPIPEEEGGNELAGNLSKLISFRTSQNFFNWKSWWLSIDKEPSELFKSFSHHHQKSIKQGLKHAITFKPVTTAEQARKLSELYIEMYQHRKLPVIEKETHQLFFNICNYIRECNKGLMLEAVLDDQTVGGVVIIFQGKTAYYYLGVTTIKYKRSIPILYPAFYHIMEYCWKSGITIFDFGGIDPSAQKGDSMFTINSFKMGFGGKLINYPDQLVFDLNPLLSRGIEKGIQVRNTFRKWKQKKSSKS